MKEKEKIKNFLGKNSVKLRLKKRLLKRLKEPWFNPYEEKLVDMTIQELQNKINKRIEELEKEQQEKFDNNINVIGYECCERAIKELKSLLESEKDETKKLIGIPQDALSEKLPSENSKKDKKRLKE